MGNRSLGQDSAANASFVLDEFQDSFAVEPLNVLRFERDNGRVPVGQVAPCVDQGEAMLI
jgi:hypothetical protein